MAQQPLIPVRQRRVRSGGSRRWKYSEHNRRIYQVRFSTAVREQLGDCLPTTSAGGVVCVLDNLELLRTSSAARQVLEELRDRLLNVDGLRWILCGSRGIVSSARSQRLSGVIDFPMSLGPLSDDRINELIEKRITYFGVSDTLVPVSAPAFEYLYQSLNQNLRDALAYAQQFAHWLYEEYVATGGQPPPEAQIGEDLERWLAMMSDRAHAATGQIQRRVWIFFDQLAANGGTCRSSQFNEYGFSTQQQMSGSITNLEGANLVVREIDPENAARTLATITAEGWLVIFHRNRYAIPTQHPKT